MPKREATPPPGDDEPKYLTVCYPYPPHANMELPGDRLALARWLACCMRTSDDLYAIFHKPSAPNMIIVEVRRDYPGFRQLLGAHKWSEFVKSPGEHSDKITRIYFSAFPTGRAVEKAGWKRIFVADNWFQGFSPNNKYIAYPYPISHYCDPPSEDQTGFTLCRPIPRETFSIQIPAPPPVPVGSASWVAQKEYDGSKKSFAVAANHARKDNLQMPTPSSLPPGIVFSSRNPPDYGNHSSHISTTSVGYPSSSSVSYHSSSPVSRPQSGANTGGSSADSSQISISGDCHSPGSVGGMKGNRYVAGGYFDAPEIEDEFGTLSLHPATNSDGTPLCPSHGVVCKKGICRDYANLLKKIEREQKQMSPQSGKRARGRARAVAGSNRISVVARGRGRGNYRARGLSPARGRGLPRGTTVAGSSRAHAQSQ